MAIIDLNTDNPTVSQRGYGFGATHVSNLGFVANTSKATQYITAPCAGKLKNVTVMGDVTSDGTATYTIEVVNESNSDVDMIGTTEYDADPVLTAGTAAEATLSSTAANLVVSKGDIISVSHTGGTGSGNAGVVVEFEEA